MKGAHMEDKKIPDELLQQISGGTLPDNWQQLADMYASMYLKMYKGVTYEKACEMLKSYFPDPEDQKLLFEYIKKYF